MGDITLDRAIADIETHATAGLRKAVKDGTYDVEKQRATNAEQRTHYDARMAKKTGCRC